MIYLAAKAIHVIGFISWFAGLFYVVRLFVYAAEAETFDEPRKTILRDQYRVMAFRLWVIITVPAMLLTLAGGSVMLWSLGSVPAWLHPKLSLVAILVGYHLACGRIRAAQAAGDSPLSPRALRIFNEVATMLMVGIVMIAVFKTLLSVAVGVAVLLTVGVLLMLGIRGYSRVRARHEARADDEGTAS